MSGLTRDQVLLMALEAGFPVMGPARADAAERFAALAYAAGQAAERAKMPPEPLIVDASHIDKDALAAAMKRARPVMLAAAPATRRENIDALVGDRLTAQKADHICERDGYTVTGVVLTLPDGRACIVNRSAVRWLQAGDLFNLLHTDSAINQRLVNEAVAAEREACAKVAEAEVTMEGYEKEIAAAIRARGTA